MLISLHIENLAVIKCVDIDFDSGFTVLSGETGAGKSIIIDSINLLLGAKADKELIRNGETCAMISGLFGCFTKRSVEALEELGLNTDDDGNILIQRTLSQDGRSQIRINGRAISLSVLKSLSAWLIGIHGQHDTNALSDPEMHRELLDKYSGCEGLLSEYESFYDEYESIRRDIREISEKANESERMREILEYQIKDIDSLSLKEGEEEELVEKKVKIKNSEKITKNSEFAFKALKGSEKGSVSYLLDRTAQALSQLSGIVPQYDEYSVRLKDILYQVDDIAEEVYAVIADMDEDPTETLNSIESRLDKISKLKRKYGLTVSDILAFREKTARELELIDNSEGILRELGIRLDKAYTKAVQLADIIHEKRVKFAKSLEGGVKNTLEFLDMPKVVFFASIKESYDGERKKLGRYGYDSVEFYISANRGAEPQPISKIASGGELARIMLALKGIISDKDSVNTVIFDEIDAGVSGKTARKIGIKMLGLSGTLQLLCVTHSAQIASLADKHYLIGKSDVNGATETYVRELDKDGRIAELSRILGGIDVTEAQRAAAVDMLNEKDSYITN